MVPQDKQGADDRGYGGQGEEEPVAEDVEQGDGDEDADDGPGVVHGPEQAEVAAAVLVGRDVGDHGVARGAPDLAGPVEDAEGDEVLPDGGSGVAEPRKAAAEVADPDEDLALADPVG